MHAYFNILERMKSTRRGFSEICIIMTKDLGDIISILILVTFV